MQFCLGGKVLDSISFKDVPGAGDLEPKPASLWWTSTDADERMDDILIKTTTRLHKLPFEKKFKVLEYTFNQGHGKVDMKFVCPQNVKKTLLKQARATYWRKCAAKHEYEELKEGVCFDLSKPCYE